MTLTIQIPVYLKGLICQPGQDLKEILFFGLPGNINLFSFSSKFQ